MDTPAPTTTQHPFDGEPVAGWLRTPRLLLREFTPADAPALQRMHEDPRLRAHLIDDAPLHEAATAALFVQRIAEVYRTHRGLGIWCACLLGPHHPPQGRFAGWFSLMPMTGHPGEVELGSRLLPAHWGSGLALDGGEALLHHAFDRLGLPRVWGLCAPANRGARLCLAALGFGPGVMAPCDGGEALHHRVDGARFRRTLAQPRRKRLQQAARAAHLTTKVNA